MKGMAPIIFLLALIAAEPGAAASAGPQGLPWLVCGDRPCTETARWRTWPEARTRDRGPAGPTLHLAGGYCLDLGAGRIERMRFVQGLVLVWRGGRRALFLQEVSLEEKGWPALPVAAAGTRMDAARRDGVTALWHVTAPPVPQWTAYIVPDRLREQRYVIQLALSGFTEREAEAVLGSLRPCRWGDPAAEAGRSEP